MKNTELDWPEFLRNLAGHASSQRAKDICLSMDALSSAATAHSAAQNVLHAQAAIAGEDIADFSVVDHVAAILERLEMQASLDINELCTLRLFLNLAVTVKAILKLTKNPWTDSLSAKLADFKPQLSAINHVVSHDGEINEDASPTLSSLMQERRKLSREIARLLDEIVLRRKMEPYLQDRYVTNREGRMVIPVKSGSQHDVKGLIHDASQSKQTVFMEPEEVVPMNNRLREVQIQIQDEVARILRELSEYLARFETQFTNAETTLLDSDINFAKARLNRRLNGTAAEFSESTEVVLNDLRHPLLALQGVDVVPNTVHLREGRRVLLLSGPNAGGKTILLKAIGLAAQMARSGFPLPVREGSRLPFFKTVDAIVGDLQSVGENLSSFSSHVTRLNRALQWQGPGTLVLVDEIMGATDPEEGAALARSYIENFCEQNVFAVVTSHLGPLKENWPKDLGVEHGSLEFDQKTNRPTFQLLLGFPGRSLALSVAQRLGTPAGIIERARAFLSPDSRKRTESLQEIEIFKQNMIDLKNEMQRDRDEAKRAKDQYQELIRKFREQRDKWLEKALQKAEKRIENLIEDARQERLKNKSLQELKTELPEIVKARPGGNRPQTLDEFRRAFPPGTPALSLRLGRQVLVQSEPDQKGQVQVLADSMRVQLPWHGLSPVGQSEEKPRAVVRRSGAAVTTDAEASPDELDLRGQRIDDALPILEKWLDDCIRNQKDRVKIIHGFGTEQLKKAIRQFLSKSRYVATWKAGDQSSGGDGVTWVSLAD